MRRRWCARSPRGASRALASTSWRRRPSFATKPRFFALAPRPTPTLDPSPLINHALLGFANVLVTPHNAYNTTEALARIIDTTLANIEAFARGAPQNVVVAP